MTGLEAIWSAAAASLFPQGLKPRPFGSCLRRGSSRAPSKPNRQQQSMGAPVTLNQLHLPALLLRLARLRRRRRLPRRCDVSARRDVGHVGQMRNPAAGGVGNINAGVIEQ